MIKYSRRRWSGHNFYEDQKYTPNSEYFDSEIGFRIDKFVSVFTDDVSRILYSSAFRRLQNKTQVHPFPVSDNIRNRLTHTIEVANIAKLIGTAVANSLKETKKLDASLSVSDFVDVVVAASLAHDIGNPPFGHTGEDAIGSWFHENAKKSKYKILRAAKKDSNFFLNLTRVDGNALGFRILTRTQGWKHDGGLRLSASVLAAFMKYPFSAQTGRFLEKKKQIKKGKFGFLDTEASCAESVFKECGMKPMYVGKSKGKKHYAYARHPLSYIMEAADDIAYLTTDIQDGHKYGSFEFEKAERLLLACSSKNHRMKYDLILDDDKNGKIQYLRTACVNTLSEQAFKNYIMNIKKIESGDMEFEFSLLGYVGTYQNAIKNIRNACKEELYYTKSKMNMEAGGHHVLDIILENLVGLVNEIYVTKQTNVENISKMNRNIFYVLPKGFRNRLIQSTQPDVLLRYVCDFVVNMTDVYALEFKKILTGVGLNR